MSVIVIRPAPIVPAGPNSLAAKATRRCVLGAIAALPALGTALPTLAAPAPDDWHGLVQTYRRHKIEWEALNRVYEDRLCAFLDRRPTEPIKPNLAEPVRQNMTIAEIKAIPFDRDWSVYEAEMAEWEAVCQTLRQEIVGTAKAAAKVAWGQYTDALQAIEAYPTPTLAVLAEKVVLIAAEYDCDDDHIQRVFADVRRLARETLA